MFGHGSLEILETDFDQLIQLLLPEDNVDVGSLGFDAKFRNAPQFVKGAADGGGEGEILEQMLAVCT